jgi:hypothetical protein
MMAPPNTVNIGATSVPASYNQCKWIILRRNSNSSNLTLLFSLFCTQPLTSTLMLVYFSLNDVAKIRCLVLSGFCRKKTVYSE